jgi:hypothetical protein
MNKHDFNINAQNGEEGPHQIWTHLKSYVTADPSPLISDIALTLEVLTDG